MAVLYRRATICRRRTTPSVSRSLLATLHQWAREEGTSILIEGVVMYGTGDGKSTVSISKCDRGPFKIASTKVG